MPPKAKFTKEEIAEQALNIIKEEGAAALTARSLGERLGTSSRPIFTAFENMNEVKAAARAIAMREFEEYISDFEEYKPAFKRIGMQMINYGIHQPELFKLLFMHEHSEARSFEDIMTELGGMAEICVGLIQRDYKMTRSEAKILFEDMWVYTFGIGALCAMRVCDFTEEETAERLGRIFVGQAAALGFNAECCNESSFFSTL